MMTNVREIYQSGGWAGVLLEVRRRVKLAHVTLLESAVSVGAGLAEALAPSTQAPVSRKGAKRVYRAQARLVDGARDASQSVARLTDADDVPMDAFRGDLKRKVSLRKVMHPDESEGILDDLFDDEKDKDEPECHDSLGFVVPCDSPDTVDASERLSERNPRRATSPMGMTPQGDTRDEPEHPRDGAQLSKEDVNYRYSTDPARTCGNCVNFIEPGSCKIVAGLIRRVDLCDLWAPRNKPAEPSFYGR